MDPQKPALNIEQHLRSREWFRTSGIAARLVVGLPALLVGPIILSCIYWAIGLLWDKYVPWTWVFVGSLIVLIPLLFWTEWRSGGSYYSEAILSTHTLSDLPLQPIMNQDVEANVRWYAMHPRDLGIGLVELFLWGPRQILEAVRAIRGLRQLRAVDRNHAALLLGALQTCDHMELKDLPTHDAGRVVVYLVWFEWIGISADANRVWMESDSREILKN